MSAELIHQMYIAYYQRPADPGGHQFWLNRLNAEGGGATGWAAISADFITSSESDALYGNVTPQEKIAKFYEGAFGRAGTSDEITALIATDATANLGQLAYTLVQGATGNDLLTVNQKVDYAEAFVAELDPNGLGIGPFQFYYEDPSLGRTLNTGVTKDSDVSSASVLSQVQASIPTSDPLAASPALPAAERTTELASGPDVIALTGETTDQINAALGGSSPTLSRSDQIDGGSAQDIMSVAMDGNFLLGFNSDGFVRNVEIIDLAASAPSVTPKTFNFTGVTGVDQINVGAGNAPIIISNISDTGLVVNVSGQTTGAFDVGFASGTISGTGSSLTVGASDLGSNGNNISLTADLITDLEVVSYGRGNYIDLGSSVNDLQNVSISGRADIYIESLPTSVSGFTATGAAGDVTIGIDATTTGNTHLSDPTATITGGAGHDTIRLDTGGTFAPGTTMSFEELHFDGAISSLLTVKATGMNGLNTLTFSGVTGTVPVINGLGDQALTVNAILESSPSGGSPDISGTGTLTVNLNPNVTQAALGSVSTNNFKFDSSTLESVNINVNSYVSSSGTFVLDSRGDVNIVVDSTSTFGNTVRASGAQTITVSGKADIAATISGKEAETINIDVGSGSLAVGSSAASTFQLSSTSGLEILTGSRLSGVQTMTVDVGQNTADLANLLGFQDMRILTLSGAGSSSQVLMGEISGSGNTMSITMSGLAGGFSAAEITNQSGNITLDAGATTGTLDVENLNNLKGGNINIVAGTAGNFSSSNVESVGTFTLDATAHTSGSGSISLGALSASGAVNIALGSGSGDLTLTDIESSSTFTVDGNSYGGNIDVANISGVGNTTFQLGSAGHFSAQTILVKTGTFVIDGANATTGLTTIQNLTAGGGVTISMGTGTGDATLSAVTTGGQFTLDASNFGGELHTDQLTASGAVVVSTGTLGHYSAGMIASEGTVTLDGSNGTTGNLTVTNVSAGGTISVSIGTGTGEVVMASATTGKNFVLDAGNFEGDVRLGLVTASGTGTVSVGPKGQLSATEIITMSNLTIDAEASTSGNINLTTISAGGNVSISMGTGTGDITMTDAYTQGKFTLDAARFGGTLNLEAVSASGAVAISLGTIGDLSAANIHTTGSLTIDGDVATTGQVTLGTLSASGVNISMGTGSSGNFGSTVNLHSDAGFIFDATNFDGTVNMITVSASGSTIIQVGDGDFSAGTTHVTENFTLDKSTGSSGNVNLNTFSAGGNVSISLGTGSGNMSSTTIESDGSFTLNANSFTGGIILTALSAGTTAINLGGAEGAGKFTAGTIYSTSSITFTQATASSGDIVIAGISASGAVSFALGAGEGDGTITISSVQSDSGFSMTGSQTGNLLIDVVSDVSGNVTFALAGSGGITSSSIHTDGTFTFSRPIGSGATAVIGDISANAVSITLGAASSHFSALTIDAGEFTFDATANIEEDLQNTLDVISASGATTISLGANAGLAVSALSVKSAGEVTITKGTGSSEVAFAVGISSEGLLTINGNGTGELSVSTIGTDGGFTLNGAGLAASNYFSANTITATSGDVTFQFGGGVNGFADVSSIDTISAFTLIGASLSTADIVINNLSATDAISISNLGNASGSLAISAIDTDGVFTVNGGATEGIALAFGTVSAETMSMVLGGSKEVSFSALNVDTITIDGTNFKGDLTFADAIATTAMSITLGSQASAVTISAMTTETFTLTHTGGGPLSAELTGINVSAFTITGSEDGSGRLDISTFNFSASGTITGSGGDDDVKVSSMSLSSQEITFTFDMRDDSEADSLIYTKGAGKEIVKILNFKTGQDKVSASFVSTSYSAGATAMTTTTAALILSDALDRSISASELGTAGLSTAMFSLGGDIFALHSAGDTGNALDAGEVIFQFVGIESLSGTDITGIS